MCDDKRRDFLKISGHTALLAAASPLMNLGGISIARAAQSEAHILVYVFIRGGWDGLSVMLPTTNATGLADLRKLRPVDGKIALKQNEVRKLKDASGDTGFGFHPAMAGLHDLWMKKQLAVIHGAGSLSENRSHFEQMALIETGVAANGVNVPGPSGFMNRALLGMSSAAVIQGVAVSSLVPTSLKGPKPTLASANFQQYFRQVDGSRELRNLPANDLKGSRERLEDRIRNHLVNDIPETLSPADRQLIRAGRNGLRSFDVVEDILAASPNGDYGSGGAAALLSQAARVVKAQRGKPSDQAVRTITVDIGGWDSHFRQQEMLAGSLTGLDTALTAFAKDVLPLGNVTIVVQSEFGRTAYENGTGGTDHGRGSVMMILTPPGQLAKRILVDNGAQKFSLKEADLVAQRDLRVLFDYRLVFAEILTKRMGLSRSFLTQGLASEGLAPVFPGLPANYKTYDIFKAASA